MILRGSGLHRVQRRGTHRVTHGFSSSAYIKYVVQCVNINAEISYVQSSGGVYSPRHVCKVKPWKNSKVGFLLRLVILARTLLCAVDKR